MAAQQVQPSRAQSLEPVMKDPSQLSVPTSTYPHLSGTDLRDILFFKKKNGTKLYFEFRELMMMYQTEIKKRWDTRAQIKDNYTFPRTMLGLEPKAIVEAVVPPKKNTPMNTFQKVAPKLTTRTNETITQSKPKIQTTIQFSKMEENSKTPSYFE